MLSVSLVLYFSKMFFVNFLLKTVGRSGRSKGFGFVKVDPAVQQAALQKLDKVESLGRVLTVKIALNPEPVPEGEPANDQKVLALSFICLNFFCLHMGCFRRKSKI
jgi:RNA recognition motif-containing protein